MNKTFFVISLIVSLAFGAASFSEAQSLVFCKKVGAGGNPVDASTYFRSGSSTDTIYFLVHIPNPMLCSYVNYEIYTLEGDGKEQWAVTIKQDGIGSDWTWFWKKITFYESGSYAVYVKDCNSKIIADGKLRILLYK